MTAKEIPQFRAFNKLTKRMYYARRSYESFVFKGDGRWAFIDKQDQQVYAEDSSSILMVSTGLKNVNGQSIWEGDIVYKDKRDYEVTRCNGGFKLIEMKSIFDGAEDQWLHEAFPLCRCENMTNDIITTGNIYEKK